MLAKITKSGLSGTIAAIGSKSDVHRALIAAALSSNPTVIENVLDSDDISATMRCLTAIGARFKISGNTVRVFPPEQIFNKESPVLDCGESGSTLRFLLPVVSALGIPATFTGSGRLPSRPISRLTGELCRHGISFHGGDTLPFSITGKLSGGLFSLPGDISSQFFSGILMAIPLTKSAGCVEATTKLESAGYFEMTRRTLATFGIKTAMADGACFIPGNAHYNSPGKLKIDGDWSNAAFWFCAGAISNKKIEVHGLNPNSVQLDREITSILKKMGAAVTVSSGSITVIGDKLRGIQVDAANIPDLVPAIATVAAFAEGETTIYNAERLRMKESDRLSALCNILGKFGIGTKETGGRLTIHGGKPHGGEIDGHSDHRIVMASTIIAANAEGTTLIHGANAVNKSYPGFFKSFTKLGGNANVILSR